MITISPINLENYKMKSKEREEELKIMMWPIR